MPPPFVPLALLTLAGCAFGANPPSQAKRVLPDEFEPAVAEAATGCAAVAAAVATDPRAAAGLAVVEPAKVTLVRDVAVPVLAPGAAADRHACVLRVGAPDLAAAAAAMEPALGAAPARRRNPEYARLERELRAVRREREEAPSPGRLQKTGDVGLDLIGNALNGAIGVIDALFLSGPSAEERDLAKRLAVTPEYVEPARTPAPRLRLPLELVETASGRVWTADLHAETAEVKLSDALAALARGKEAARVTPGPARPLVSRGTEPASAPAAPGPALALAEAEGVAFYVTPDHLLTAAKLDGRSSLVPVDVPGTGRVWTMIEAEDPRRGLTLLYTPRPGEPLDLAANAPTPARTEGLVPGTPLLANGGVAAVVDASGEPVAAGAINAFLAGVRGLPATLATPAAPSPR